ncbi:hypothetical protein BMETH_517_1 [methanotrophic bacterial endosymbiont of Bathymodiolus sp.]|nr:hypothetical protein BMETH_517_1 [methanotrophic bacterial endosymbiont of Bathymodiolus sp.]
MRRSELRKQLAKADNTASFSPSSVFAIAVHRVHNNKRANGSPIGYFEYPL